MKKILLCTANPILIKSLYGVLRDDGHDVDVVEHPAFAVQKALGGGYTMLIVDAEPFGLSAGDAVQIIRQAQPDLPVVAVGRGERGAATAVASPVDLEMFKRTIHSIAV